VTGPRTLSRDFHAYRIGDPNGSHPIFSAEGARRVGGRWHRAGDAVIYASEHYATAMLEKLTALNGILPPNQHFIVITVPAGTSYEVVTADVLPDWYTADAVSAQAYGHRWYIERRSALLIVPSVPARMERNIVINADHPEADAIEHGFETPVWWDERLFTGP